MRENRYFPVGGDWIDRNFEALREAKFLKRRRNGHYSITRLGAARAVGILQESGCLNFHRFHMEENFDLQHSMLQEAADVWLSHEKRQAGTQNHILIDVFQCSLV